VTVCDKYILVLSIQDYVLISSRSTVVVLDVQI